jgi:hypothetical protein
MALEERITEHLLVAQRFDGKADRGVKDISKPSLGLSPVAQSTRWYAGERSIADVACSTVCADRSAPKTAVIPRTRRGTGSHAFS